MLRIVGWFRTDVSGLRIGPMFDGQDVEEGHLDRHVAPKRIPEDDRI